MRLKSIFALSLMAACSIHAQQQISMVVGTYTDGGSKGIYTYRFNQDTGKVGPSGLIGDEESVVSDSLR